jgi:HK97 family phage portal protein
LAKANLIQRFFQKALGMEAPAAEQRSLGFASPGIASLFNISEGNVTVNDVTISSIPALVRAIEIVASAIAKLPVTVFTKSSSGVTTLDRHPASLLCNTAPNMEQTPYAFWWSMVANAFLSGGGGAEIIRNANGMPVALRLMRYGCTPYKINSYDSLRYYDNEDGRLYFPEDVIFLPGIFMRDGFTARPIAQAFKNAFGEPLAQSLLANTLFKQGVYPSAVYSYQGTKTGLKGDEAAALDISRYFGGLEKAGMVIPIPNMDKFTPIPRVSFVDSQMLAMRQFSIAEIARITGVPADMLGETEKQSYSFSEQSAKSFIMYTLDPWLTKRDQELCMKLLTQSEKGRVKIETFVNETMWMLPKDRMEYNWKKFQMGALTPNEVRAYDNESPVDSGDKTYVQSQLIPTDLIEEFWTSKNTNQGTQPDAQRSDEPLGKKINGHVPVEN